MERVKDRQAWAHRRSGPTGQRFGLGTCAGRNHLEKSPNVSGGCELPFQKSQVAYILLYDVSSGRPLASHAGKRQEGTCCSHFDNAVIRMFNLRYRHFFDRDLERLLIVHRLHGGLGGGGGGGCHIDRYHFACTIGFGKRGLDEKIKSTYELQLFLFISQCIIGQ